MTTGAVIAIALFLFCLVVQGVYLALLGAGFRRSFRSAPDVPPENTPCISVVVAARNEAKNLPKLLAALSGQAYEWFEVVIADDGSHDATADLVQEWGRRDVRFHLVTVQPSPPRKKNALTVGIRTAAHDLLAFTDADCQPPPGWLTAIVAGLRERDAVLVGYSPFARESTLVNRVSRYETFVTGFLTAAAIGMRRPYMAVGRNLSYSKRTFETVRGYDHSSLSLSGDDDLLVQEADRQGVPVIHLFGSESYVPTRAPGSWSEWLRQKRRHASAGKYYATSVKGHLLAYHSTAHVLWLAPFVAGLPGLGLLAMRLFLLWATLARPASVFRERDLLIAMPIWELAYALYNVLVAPVGIALGPRRWKTGAARSTDR